MKKYIVIIFFTLFCISSFLGGVYFNNFINNWDLLILTFGLLGFYLCLLENKITKELFLLLFFIILVPLIFFSGLSLIDTRLVSSINDWIGFLGAYFGVIGTIGSIWWQLKETNKKEKLGALNYSLIALNAFEDRAFNIFQLFYQTLSSNISLDKTNNNNLSIIYDYELPILFDFYNTLSVYDFFSDFVTNINDIILIQERYIKYITIAQSDLNSKMFKLLESRTNINFFPIFENKVKNLNKEFRGKKNPPDKIVFLIEYLKKMGAFFLPLYNNIGHIKLSLLEDENFDNPEFIEFATKVSNLYSFSSVQIPKMLENTKKLKELLDKEIKKLS